MKLYLLRHGETTLNQKKVYYGSTDCELTAKGEAQAASLRPIFADIPFDTVWSSPLKRATATAALALGVDRPDLARDERLAEMAFGAWEGCSWQDLQGDALFETWCADWRRTRPPGGESFDDLSCRVRRFYTEVLRPFSGENGLVVAHHAVLRLLTLCLLDLYDDAFWRFAFTQGAYSVFEINDGFAVFAGHNLLPPKD